MSDDDVKELLAEVRAADARGDQLKSQAAHTLEARNTAIRKLRPYLSAAQIADRVGLTRQTIHAVLQGAPVPSEELDPDELGGLINRLSDSARQFQDVANGKTILAEPNPVGMQMLSDNLKWAVEWLESVLVQQKRTDKWTRELVADWHAYEDHRWDDASKSRQYPHQQDLIVHKLANRLSAQDAATVLGIRIEDVVEALERPGLDGRSRAS